MRNQPSPKNASAVAAGLFAYPDITPGPRITTSPAAPGSEQVPRLVRDRDLRSRSARPTEPGTRSDGGSGLDAIWWLASVIP